MNCAQVRNLFDTYLDGELSGSLATEFDAHRLQCAACRRELALLEVAGHIVAADSEPPVLTDEFTQRLLACAVPKRRGWYLQRQWWWYAGAPLAAAACLALLFAWFRGSPAKPGHPAEPMVLPGRDVVETQEELLENVERAFRANPGDVKLQKLAEDLRQRVGGVVQDTIDGANVLEQYGKSTVLEILRSIPVEPAGESKDGMPAADTSTNSDGPSVENL